MISTHRHVVEMARGNGALTILRLLAIDTSAVERGLKVLRKADPDAVEIFPRPRFPRDSRELPGCASKPVLMGGLIKDHSTAATSRGRGGRGPQRATTGFGARLTPLSAGCMVFVGNNRSSRAGAELKRELARDHTYRPTGVGMLVLVRGSRREEVVRGRGRLGPRWEKQGKGKGMCTGTLCTIH